MDTLKAEKRSMDVKAKKLRREGYVVGNVFGREIEGSVPVKMNKQDVEKLLKKDPQKSAAVDMTALGLMELTRKKQKKTLKEQAKECGIL